MARDILCYIPLLADQMMVLRQKGAWRSSILLSTERPPEAARLITARSTRSASMAQDLVCCIHFPTMAVVIQTLGLWLPMAPPFMGLPTTTLWVVQFLESASMGRAFKRFTHSTELAMVGGLMRKSF